MALSQPSAVFHQGKKEADVIASDFAWMAGHDGFRCRSTHSLSPQSGG